MNEQSPYTPEEELARARLKAVLTDREFIIFDAMRDVIEDTYSAEVTAMKARYPDFHSSLFDSLATALSDGDGKVELAGWRDQMVSETKLSDLVCEMLLNKIYQYMDERGRNN